MIEKTFVHWRSGENRNDMTLIIEVKAIELEESLQILNEIRGDRDSKLCEREWREVCSPPVDKYRLDKFLERNKRRNDCFLLQVENHKLRDDVRVHAEMEVFLPKLDEENELLADGLEIDVVMNKARVTDAQAIAEA